MLDTAQYSVQGAEPRGVDAPDTPEALAAALAEAAADGVAVVPWGAGVYQGMGYPPTDPFRAVTTACLNRVVEHSPADLTIAVEAGMTLRALQSTLSPHGQRVNLDAPLPGRATIGGILATALSGPRRLGYGLPRDQVIGMRVARPDGTLARSGGRVVKNVTGFDMGRLYTGSLGTLGVIVEVGFRLSPLPAVSATLTMACRDSFQALALAEAIRQSRLQPAALDALSSEALAGALGVAQNEWLLAVEFTGGRATVQRQVEDTLRLVKAHSVHAETPSQEQAVAIWEHVRDFGRSEPASMIILRATVLPSHLPDLVAAVDTAAHMVSASPALILRAGNGTLYAHWPAESVNDVAPETWRHAVAAVRAASLRQRGSAVVEECPVELKGVVDLWGPVPEAFMAMERLKEELDPGRVLNPGRYVGGL